MKAGTWVVKSRAHTAPAVLVDYLETYGEMTTRTLELQLEDRFKATNIRKALYRLVDRGEVTRTENWEGRIIWAAA
jgi:hypothetical protein